LVFVAEGKFSENLMVRDMKKMQVITSKIIIAIAPLVLGLTACGGSSDGDSSADSSSSLSSVGSNASSLSRESSLSSAGSNTSSLNSESSFSQSSNSSSSVGNGASSSASSSAVDSSGVLLGINVGGTAITVDGINYSADRYVIGGARNETGDTISGVADPALYQSERYGDFEYKIPVTSAVYSVTLHFAEIYHGQTGLRSFDVLVEGVTKMPAVDLYALAGHDGAYSYQMDNIEVTDGYLNISIKSVVENGTLAGITLRSESGEIVEVEKTVPAFFVGNITTRGAVRDDFMDYWDQITPENEGKWGGVEGTRDNYDWSGIDRAYDFAKAHGIPFKQHTFVWGSQAPDWIDDLPAQEQAEEIEEWIRDYCQRYPDTEMIDVVNEATPGHAPATFAESAFGSDWIIKSFQLARKYCPNSLLILNDYNVLVWNTNEFIQMARPAIEAGVVDALGLQAHGLHDISLNNLKANMEKVAALGLPIYISEYDVEQTDDQMQLNQLQEQFSYFYTHPSVKGITLWGYVNGATWRDGTGLILEEGTHRPAMDWLMEYLDRN